MLYYALVYPYLSHSNVVWASNYPTCLDQLQKLQKSSMSSIVHQSQYARQRFIEIHLLGVLQMNPINFKSKSSCINAVVFFVCFFFFCWVIRSSLSRYRDRDHPVTSVPIQFTPLLGRFLWNALDHVCTQMFKNDD